MSIVRVFQNPDGSVRIVHPVNEADPETVFARTVEADPSLASLPYTDVDSSTLPPRDEICLDCPNQKHSTRDQWRLKNGTVMRDPLKPNPSRDKAHQIKKDQDDLNGMLRQYRTKTIADPVTGGKPL